MKQITFAYYLLVRRGIPRKQDKIDRREKVPNYIGYPDLHALNTKNGVLSFCLRYVVSATNVIRIF